MPAQACAGIETIALGQDGIDQDSRRQSRIERFDSPSRVPDGLNVDALLRQALSDQMLPGRVVLDQQDSKAMRRKRRVHG
jgi:hypothetical protein